MEILSNPPHPTEPAPRSAPAAGAPAPRLAPRLLLILNLVLLLLAAVFFALHFVHLTADFPNSSRWMDWSKYTDEGWYGDAAIRHYQLGHWYVPGDFNPAAALPVWPFLEALVFHFTGVSLTAARSLTLAVFGATLLASWLLVTRSGQPRRRLSLAASLAVLLLATNPFCFVFYRLAILEPLLILLTLLALLAAQSVKLPFPASSSLPARDRTIRFITANTLPILALGVLLPLILLTKTTGLFLFPAIAWMLFAAVDYRPWSLFRIGIPAATLAAGLWLAYFLLLVRPHYLADYRYLFSANTYTAISLTNYPTVLRKTFEDGFWFGELLFSLALAAIATAAFSLRRLRNHPLIPVLILWAAGYATFLAYHNNLQPRYYLVVAVPLTLLVPVAWRDLALPRLRSSRAASTGALVAALLIAFIVIPDARQTIAILRKPEYTLLNAANQIHDYIAADTRQHPNHNPLVLSISGSDLSLMTGLHSICDDFGTLELVDRVKRYNPGWYVAWNLIEDDKMDALTPDYHVHRVATFPAMDDVDRNLMVLYRLEPVTGPTSKPARPGRRSRSKPGQQPSQIQLEH